MNEQKRIEDYLKYYWGQDCRLWSLNYDGQIFKIDGVMIALLSMPDAKIMPVLRPLYDMKEDEALQAYNIQESHKKVEGWQVHNYYSHGPIYLTTAEFHYFLSRGFDLFGLIDSGLAIDKTKTI